MRRKNQKPDNCDESCFGCKNRFSCRKRVLLGYEKLAFGSTADAFNLFDKFEAKVEEYMGDLTRASVELAKDWRTDKNLRKESQ